MHICLLRAILLTYSSTHHDVQPSPTSILEAISIARSRQAYIEWLEATALSIYLPEEKRTSIYVRSISFAISLPGVRPAERFSYLCISDLFLSLSVPITPSAPSGPESPRVHDPIWPPFSLPRTFIFVTVSLLEIHNSPFVHAERSIRQVPANQNTSH